MFKANVYTLDSLKVVKYVYIKDTLVFLGWKNSQNYLKLISKQKKKYLFFEKFLVKNILSSNLKKTTYLKNNVLNKFFRTFLVSGKKIKVYNALIFSFFRVYATINLDIFKNLSQTYLYFKEFLFNKELNKELNNITAIIDWLFFWYQPIFCVKCSLVPKKYRKKLKKKYVYAVNYIDPLKRKNISLRWMLHFLDSFNNYNFKNRLFLLLGDLIFNFKKSVMYDRKVRMYRKMFKV